MEEMNMEPAQAFGAAPSGQILPAEDISAFCMEMALFLKSGIPIAFGISVMMENMENKEGKAILNRIYEKTDMGEPLYTALDDTGSFPPYLVHMAELGERTGSLERVMLSLSEYYKRECEMHKNIKSAITYPLVMVVMMLVVISVLVVKVLPVFDDVFRQLGTSIPPFAAYLVNMGGAFTGWAIGIVALVAALLFVVYWMGRTENGRKRLSRISGKLFGRRKLSQMIALARFTSAMGMTMASGLDSDESLLMTEQLIENPVMKKKVLDLKSHLAEGETFADSVAAAGILSGIELQMVRVGFQAGSADEVLLELAERFQSDVEGKIDSMISVIEPTLVIILSVVVGSILLTVMLPLIGIMASIG